MFLLVVYVVLVLERTGLRTGEAVDRSRLGSNRHEAWSPFPALRESEQLPGHEPEL